MAQANNITNNCTNTMPKNHDENYYRIDTPVKPYSYWQAVFISLFIIAILIAAIMVDLAGWMLLIVVLTCLATVIMLYTQPKLLINLTSPPLYHLEEQGLGTSRGYWQLLWQTTNNQQLWEAKLIQCQRYGHCIQLSFLVTHPMPCNLTYVIWQDQVSTQTWRRLSAIARW